MAGIIIKIEKEDINTGYMGCNYMVKCNNGISLIFTPEALDELILDYKQIKEEISGGANYSNEKFKKDEQ